jgi:multicomponent Na+:H+ antiporter subunit D
VTGLLLVPVVVPWLGALWIAAAGRQPRACARASVVVALTTALACAAVALMRPGEFALFEIVPPVALVLRADAAGVLFALTVAGLYALATIHAGSWLAAEGARPRAFHAVFLVCLGAMLLVAFAANLVTLLVGYELFSLASVLLIVHRRTPRAFRAGLKYLLYVMPGSTLTLVGILIVYFAADTLAFVPGGLSDWRASDGFLRAAWIALVVGFGVKAALFPLHGWVPDAHPAAPAPFSAILSGVMVATGAFAIARVLFEIFGIARLEAVGVMPWLSAAAAAGVIIAGVLAVGEDELKRRLAYSTISQMGYATLALSLLDQRALAGALAHLSGHAFVKGGLFFVAGAIAAHAGVHRVSEMAGLGRRMPITATALTLLALALIGLPPMVGFVAKWLLVSGAAGTGAWSALAVLLAGSVLAALYLWPLIRAAWSAAPGSVARHEPLDGMLIATLGACALALMFGIAAPWPGFPLALAEQAAAVLTGGSGP